LHYPAMQKHMLSAPLQIIAAGCLIVLVGAAAPVVSSITPLPGPAGAEPPAKTVTAANTSFQEAPVPDQDVDAPPDTSNPSATLSPKLLSQKSLFQGDGYYYASSEQTTLDGRRSAAPGLGLNVPVQ
jgi:hypothetical protein